jgi:hypothetical protein
MKKPYIKKFSKISSFTVWIVDGEYVRENIDEEFTNYGQHCQFSFIPKNEFWIDKERVPGEEKYYIESMLVVNRLISKGADREKAIEEADKAERRERAKSKLMKKEIEIRKDQKELLRLIHKNLLQKYSGKKLKVWIVNGEAVRNLFFIDFTEGGHGYVYDFIPKDEVWIDDDVEPDEIKFVLLHELHERNLMSKGKKYDPAHKSSSNIEFYCRHHSEKLNRKLMEEIKKNKN